MMRRLSIKGVTLIELLIAISLFAVIALLVGSLFFSGFNGYVDNTERLAGQAGVRLAIFEITNALRIAEPGDVSISNGGNTIAISSATYTFTINTGEDYGVITKTTAGNSKQIAENIKDFNASMVGDMVDIAVESKWDDSHVETKVFTGIVPTPSPTPFN